MRADFLGTDLGKKMDAELERMKEEVDKEFSLLAPAIKNRNPTAEKVIEMIDREDFDIASGFNVPMAKR
jgi:hypothetical protein